MSIATSQVQQSGNTRYMLFISLAAEPFYSTNYGLVLEPFSGSYSIEERGNIAEVWEKRET